MSAQSRAERVIGPMWSIDHASGSTPARLTRPYVGLSPVMPHSEAGMRIELPVSEPSEPGASPAATAAPDLEDDPPAMRCASTLHGFLVSPWCALLPSGPYANSCMFSVPRRIAPARASRATTVALSPGTESARILELPVVRTPFVE